MSVVSDTTPLNYLILIDAVEVLPKLFGRVYTPTAVLGELRNPKSPERVRRWVVSPPAWLTVQDPAYLDRSLPTKLGDGEVAAISLGLEMNALLLLDDKDARKAAGERNLSMARTLNVLIEAASRDFIDIHEAVSGLRGTTYRAEKEHYQAAIEQVRERKTSSGQDRSA